MHTDPNPALFLEISAVLTGFSQTELKATGMAEAYYNTILENTDGEDIEYFFLNVKAILTAPKRTEQSIEEAVAAQLIPDSCYGGLGKNITALWYTGNWMGNVVSAASYIQGLMWDAGHTHPPGAKQPGFGSWANIPLTVKQPKK